MSTSFDLFKMQQAIEDLFDGLMMLWLLDDL
jgi:hypothetical protein